MTIDLKPERRIIKGQRVVILPETAYDELIRQVEAVEPALPAADANGNRPADAYAAVSIARDIIRARRRLGLSQVQLANLAGVRVETINRIEKCRTSASVQTIGKIERAIRKAEKRDRSR